MQIYYSPGLIGSGDEGPVSQGVYVGQRAKEIAVTRPRHFPHNELKISLKSLFFRQQNPLRIYYLRFFHSYCGRLMTWAMCWLDLMTSQCTAQQIYKRTNNRGIMWGFILRCSCVPRAHRDNALCRGPYGSLYSILPHFFSRQTCLWATVSYSAVWQQNWPTTGFYL